MDKKLGLLGIGLCGICCALPLIGAVIGISSLTVIAFYLEKIGIVLIGIAGIFFLYYRYKQTQSAKACNVNCDCNGSEPVKLNP